MSTQDRTVTMKELSDYIDCKQKWSLTRYKFDEKKVKEAKKEGNLRFELRLKAAKLEKSRFGFRMFFWNLIGSLLIATILGAVTAGIGAIPVLVYLGWSSYLFYKDQRDYIRLLLAERKGLFDFKPDRPLYDPILDLYGEPKNVKLIGNRLEVKFQSDLPLPTIALVPRQKDYMHMLATMRLLAINYPDYEIYGEFDYPNYYQRLDWTDDKELYLASLLREMRRFKVKRTMSQAYVNPFVCQDCPFYKKDCAYGLTIDQEILEKEPQHQLKEVELIKNDFTFIVKGMKDRYNISGFMSDFIESIYSTPLLLHQFHLHLVDPIADSKPWYSIYNNEIYQCTEDQNKMVVDGIHNVLMRYIQRLIILKKEDGKTIYQFKGTKYQVNIAKDEAEIHANQQNPFLNVVKEADEVKE